MIMKKICFCLLLVFSFLDSVFCASSKKSEIPVEEKISFFEGQSINLRPMENWGTWGRTNNSIFSKVKSENNQKIFEIKYRAKDDFSINLSDRLKINPSEKQRTYLFCSNVLLTKGSLSLCFIFRDSEENVLDWIAGEVRAEKGESYQMLYSLLTVPENVASIEPRIIGEGATQAKIMNPSLEKIKFDDAQDIIQIENEILKVTCYTKTASFDILDKRNQKKYCQSQSLLNSCIITNYENDDKSIKLTGLSLANKAYLTFTATLKGDSVEYSLNQKSFDPSLTENESPMNQNISWPQKSLSKEGDYLVIPMNEGLRIDWNEKDIYPYDLVTFGGHGICMPFYGITNDTEGNGFISIIENPDDAAIKLSAENTAEVGPVWYSQKGKFGYERKIIQTFLTGGNHVGIAKKYREYAKQKGLLLTFDEKKIQRGEKATENIDKFLGSVNIWTWQGGEYAFKLAKKIHDAGITKVLWSRKQPASTIDKINSLGFISGKYVIYQDVMNPKNYKYLQYVNNDDWIPQAYPNDIAIDKNGNLTDAWPVERKDGKGFINCASLCDMTAVNYSRADLEEDLPENNYGARFFDTTTASPFKECYSPDHPMTRTQCKEERVKLLATSSIENGLVTGSETGVDSVVPVCDYFEGMMSLGPYRVEDAGRNMDTILNEVPPQINDFQLNEKRRLPLWELVYHDACVAMWYWGDYNNKLPSVWDKRDKFNQLYAVPPMFWIHGENFFDENKDRFVQSYNASHEIIMATAGVEMVNHQYLNEGHTIQKTTFANGYEVIVDFSD